MNDMMKTEQMSLQELFERFLRLSVADGRASPRTIASYRDGLALYFSWLKDRDMDPLTTTYDEVQIYRSWLIAKYKPGTVRIRLTAVRVLYRALQRWGRRPDDPAAGIKGPKERSSPVDKLMQRGLSPDEAKLLLVGIGQYDGAAAARDRAIIELLLFQGLRADELAGARLEDLDMLGLSAIKIMGKGSKERTIMLSERCRISLKRWLELRGTLPGALFHRLEGEAVRLSVRTIERIVDKGLKRAGLKRPGRSAHALRHTYAVLSVLGGAQRERLGDSLGHASLSTTDVYIRAAGRYQENPAEAVQVALERTVTP